VQFVPLRLPELQVYYVAVTAAMGCVQSPPDGPVHPELQARTGSADDVQDPSAPSVPS
jgi:hypothetical protein